MAHQTLNVYESLITELKEISMLGSINAVLGWDEQTHLPPRGTDYRAEQSSLLARMMHERFVSPRIGEWLAVLEQSADPADSDIAVNVRETRRAYDRAVKLPTALVEELARASVIGQQAWTEARSKSDFSLFLPALQKTVGLKRQVAACIGSASGDPYDALLDEYEPGETSSNVQKTFDALRGPLVELIGKVAGSGRTAPVEILERQFPLEAQEKLGREVAAAVGFDFTGGRIDVSVHPFCTELGPGDVRMTTRYRGSDFSSAFFGVLHETGHALYDQGLDRAHYGTPRAAAVSLGIHESQSRMWENLVGGRKSFWKFFLPKVRSAFPGALDGVSDSAWHFAINDIRPSLIRVEADEATYNLHILLRFELERALISSQLAPADVPGAWNERMTKYLGLTPPNDAKGCLQDIHWSGGAIGYFPTYTLGNLYAAQFFEQADRDLGGLDGQFARGEFRPLLDWLREKIHRHGKRFTGPQLVQNITGKPLSAEPLLRHLRAKAAEVYGV
jgi:carboxypeptidase Taq